MQAGNREQGAEKGMANGHFKGSPKRHGGATSYPGWIISPAALRPLAFKSQVATV